MKQKESIAGETILIQVSISYITEHVKRGMEKKKVESHYIVDTGGEDRKEFKNLDDARADAKERMVLLEKDGIPCVRYWEFFNEKEQ